MADGKTVVSNNIPDGGEPGQVLKKASYNPYEIYWGDSEGGDGTGGGGGTIPGAVNITSQLLVQQRGSAITFNVQVYDLGNAYYIDINGSTSETSIVNNGVIITGLPKETFPMGGNAFPLFATKPNVTAVFSVGIRPNQTELELQAGSNSLSGFTSLYTQIIIPHK